MNTLLMADEFIVFHSSDASGTPVAVKKSAIIGYSDKLVYLRDHAISVKETFYEIKALIEKD